MASLKEDGATPLTPFACSLQGMEQGDADLNPPTVAGLKNLGNTCYLNAALQAMASSRTFTDCIASLAAAFTAMAAQQQQQQQGASFVQQLLAGLHVAANFVLHGA